MHNLKLFNVTSKLGTAAMFCMCYSENSVSFRNVRMCLWQLDDFINLLVLFTVDKMKLRYVSVN
jgi:hypothetical protein